MNIDDDNWLVCSLVASGESDVLSEKADCTFCGQRVWVSDLSPRGPKVICGPCFVARVTQLGYYANFELAPPTAAQLADIKDWQQRQKR